LTVRLTAVSQQTVVANYATGDPTAPGSIPATPGSDYDATSGPLTFSPGETLKTILVDLAPPNDLDEDDESFKITLTPVANLPAGNVSAQVTIDDDDLSPTVSVADS